MKNSETTSKVHVIELTTEELQEISGGTVRTSISGGAGGSSTTTTVNSA